MRIDNKVKTIILVAFIIGLIIGRAFAPKTEVKYRDHGKMTHLRTDTIPSRLDVMKENNVSPNDLARAIRSAGSTVAKRKIVHVFQKNNRIVTKEITN